MWVRRELSRIALYIKQACGERFVNPGVKNTRLVYTVDDLDRDLCSMCEIGFAAHTDEAPRISSRDFLQE